jgi:hypothetical protein
MGVHAPDGRVLRVVEPASASQVALAYISSVVAHAMLAPAATEVEHVHGEQVEGATSVTYPVYLPGPTKGQAGRAAGSPW